MCNLKQIKFMKAWKIKLPIIFGGIFLLSSLPLILGHVELSAYKGGYSAVYWLVNFPALMVVSGAENIFPDLFISNIKAELTLILFFWLILAFLLGIIIDIFKTRVVRFLLPLLVLLLCVVWLGILLYHPAFPNDPDGELSMAALIFVDIVLFLCGIIMLILCSRRLYSWGFALSVFLTPLLHLAGTPLEGYYCFPLFFGPLVLTLLFAVLHLRKQFNIPPTLAPNHPANDQ